MIQRPVSPPGLPTHTAPSERVGRVAANLRRRVTRRKCGGSIAVSCVAALCVLFFCVELRQNDMVLSTAGSESSVASETNVVPSAEATEATEATGRLENEEMELDKPAQPEPGAELERFASFEQYVDATRKEGGVPAMPVVAQGEEDVTVPSLIVIGARRSGSTSLFSMLGQHPNVVSIVPEVDRSGGFMSQDLASYPHDAEWPGDRLETDIPADKLGSLLGEYARPFTSPETNEEGGAHMHKLVTAELSPGYLSSPLAPYRLKVSMPDVKIVVVLRDPVDRYFSELRQKLCVPNDKDIDWEDVNSSFAMPNSSKNYMSEAVLDFSPYDKRCLGEGASAEDLWECQQAARRSHRPLLEGLYAGQIARWQRVFDKSQIKVVSSNMLFAEPEKIAADVAKFAGLEKHTFFEFAVDRESSCDPRRRGSTISTAYSKRKEAEPNFRKWYADHNDMLTELVDMEMGWNDRIKSMNVNGGL